MSIFRKPTVQSLMSIFRKPTVQNAPNTRPSSAPAILNSIFESPLLLAVTIMGGSWLMLDTIIDSSFPGSIEMLLTTPEAAMQLKIDGVQPTGDPIPPSGDL